MDSFLDLFLTGDAPALIVVSLLIGVVIGLTGMGGGALMTPALIAFGIPPTVAVANDLVVNAVNKVVGGAIHMRHGKPDLKIAMWLIIGSVPTALAGAWIVQSLGGDDAEIQETLKNVIGVTLLLAATTYVVRIVLAARQKDNPVARTSSGMARPVPTIIVGLIAGLLVGVTSVGSGTVVMMCLMLLYPALSALRLVGTDLVQAIPLVIAAAVGHIIVSGVDMGLIAPLILGGTIGTAIGSRLAGKVPGAVVRTGLVSVLLISGLAMLGLGNTGVLVLAVVGLVAVVVSGMRERRERLRQEAAEAPEAESERPEEEEAEISVDGDAKIS